MVGTQDIRLAKRLASKVSNKKMNATLHTKPLAIFLNIQNMEVMFDAAMLILIIILPTQLTRKFTLRGIIVLFMLVQLMPLKA